MSNESKNAVVVELTEGSEIVNVISDKNTIVASMTAGAGIENVTIHECTADDADVDRILRSVLEAAGHGHMISSESIAASQAEAEENK